MYKRIEHDRSTAWKTLTLKSREKPENVRLPVGPLLVPLSVWQARRAELIHREYEHGWPLGIWLTTEQGAQAIEQDIDDFTVIAIEFDNHSHAIARKLREQFGYLGELRLTGNIPQGVASDSFSTGFGTLAASEDTTASWFNFKQSGHAGLRAESGLH